MCDALWRPKPYWIFIYQWPTLLCSSLIMFIVTIATGTALSNSHLAHFILSFLLGAFRMSKNDCEGDAQDFQNERNESNQRLDIKAGKIHFHSLSMYNRASAITPPPFLMVFFYCSCQRFITAEWQIDCLQNVCKRSHRCKLSGGPLF